MVRDSFRPGRHRQWFRSSALVLTIGLLTGCGGGSSGTSTSAPKKSAAPESPQQALEEKCQAIIQSVHETFDLERLGQDALRPAQLAQASILNDGVQRLNDWNQSCGGSPNEQELPESVQRLMTSEQRGLVSGQRFIERDGEHLRDCLLLRSMARNVLRADPSRSERTELARVSAAFRYVIRALELVPRSPRDLPLTPFELCVLGKGTAEDRAWVFAGLLRQEKFDAVLIGRPGTAEGPSSPEGPFLVGVLADGNVYLFDPRAGIPIPGPAAEAGGDAGVATLAQAAADPAVLRQLDAPGQSYPLTAADLERPGVWLIGDAGFWSRRMRTLQAQYREKGLVIADPLHETDLGPGLLARVADAGSGRWAKEAIALWKYPEEQLASHAKLNKELNKEQNEQRVALEEVLAPFAAYRVVVVNQRNGAVNFIDREQLNDPAAGKNDPERRVMLRTTAGTEMRSRLAHLEGRFAEALTTYHEVTVRARAVVDFETTPKSMRAQHAQAIDDAKFWTGLCKFEQGDYRVAFDSLARYRRQQEDGSWTRQARYLLALCHAEQKDFAQAIAELSKVPADDPEYPGHQWLIRQWKAAAERKAEGKPDAPAP